MADLVRLMPNRYQDRRGIVPISELVLDREVLIQGVVQDIREGRFKKTFRPYFEIRLEDDTGWIAILWFSLPPHLRKTIKPGQEMRLFGRVESHRKRLQMVHPEMKLLSGKETFTPEVRPIYPEMEGIKPGRLRRVMAEVVNQMQGIPAIFPLSWLKAKALTDPMQALITLHQPPSDRPGPLPKPEESRAWRSLAFFELLLLQLSLARSKARLANENGWAFPERPALAREFLTGLPFQLTPAQTRVLSEIGRDMARDRPMNRLLQGEVGSGKTVVALAAAFGAVEGGRQAAVMAPTEILARQHFAFLEPHARGLGVPIALLVGGSPEKEKQEIRAQIASGAVRIIVGTHALIANGVTFESLGLAVIDEQHRFGVAQRLALRTKAENPDILVMTATPIPRSLAMTLYGDLDLSTIDDLPPGRRPVTTHVFGREDREEAYRMLARDVDEGGQAYVVAPRIDIQEETDGPDNGSVEELYDFLRKKVLPGIPVGLVHGRMKSKDQQDVMADFVSGRLRVLTATSVIEVGLDVPQASTILIEGAERFGLAQLHQLRGRIGRGDRPSQCLLVADRSDRARVEILAGTSDGFALAEEDLKLRGPGDPLGLKQSGLPKLSWARLPRDLSLLLQARDLAEEIIGNDPDLAEPNFKLVRDVIDQLDERIRADLADVG